LQNLLNRGNPVRVELGSGGSASANGIHIRLAQDNYGAHVI